MEAMKTITEFKVKGFEGMPVILVSRYLRTHGWRAVSCFNDYKYAWVNDKMEVSILAKVTMDPDIGWPEGWGCEMVSSIWTINSIYSE